MTVGVSIGTLMVNNLPKSNLMHVTVKVQMDKYNKEGVLVLELKKIFEQGKRLRMMTRTEYLSTYVTCRERVAVVAENEQPVCEANSPLSR